MELRRYTNSSVVASSLCRGGIVIAGAQTLIVGAREGTQTYISLTPKFTFFLCYNFSPSAKPSSDFSRAYPSAKEIKCCYILSSSCCICQSSMVFFDYLPNGLVKFSNISECAYIYLYISAHIYT
jgi:hypothetical protein